jgi:uncharacterized protein YkwD
MTNPKTLKTLSSVLTTIAIATQSACGGGGGGTTTPTATPTVTAITFTASCSAGVTKTSAVSQADADAQCPATSSIVGAVPATSYAGVSEELSAFTLLNSERAQCGFGLLAQNAQLDASAKGSADWQTLNNYGGHVQVAGTPGFTGVTAGDRNTAAGYTALYYAESYEDVTGTNFKAGAAPPGVRDLLTAPYHLNAMMSDARDAGVSVRNSTDSASTHNPRVIMMFEFAHKDADGPQSPDSNSVLTYPCNGSDGAKPALFAEAPNPVQGRDLSRAPLGTPIYIAVRRNNRLVITSASLIKVATDAPVSMRAAVTWNNDPYGEYRSHEAYIAPDVPLSGNSAYQATVTGTNNGVAFSRTFTFTTGS